MIVVAFCAVSLLKISFRHDIEQMRRTELSLSGKLKHAIR
jgi:hypothetical protein